jgi:FkbM family methyltransferase
MKKINKWWIPDFENSGKVISRIENEIWTCRDPLEKCFGYSKNFGTAIDVGAWIGDSTELISNRFQKVYAFEPSPEVYKCLVKNLTEKKITNVSHFNVGLSDHKGTVPFSFPKSTLSAWIDTVNKESNLYVECNTLDSFNFTNVDFIKIDVDSHEGYVLLGSKKFFETNNPLIMIEYKEKSRNRQSADMPNPLIMLANMGYKLVEKASEIDYIFERR